MFSVPSIDKGKLCLPLSIDGIIAGYAGDNKVLQKYRSGCRGGAYHCFAERKFSIDIAGVFPVIWCLMAADKAVKLQ